MVGTPTKDLIEVAVDGEPNQHSWVIRWGVQNDGQQDTAILYTDDGTGKITQTLSNVTLSGNIIEVWAYAFEHVYQDGNFALTSSEYLANIDNWSQPLVVDMTNI